MLAAKEAYQLLLSADDYDDLKKLMHRLDFDINSQDKDGNTFLHYIMSRSAHPQSQFLFFQLIEFYNADPTIKNKRGETALDLIFQNPDHFMLSSYYSFTGIFKLIEKKFPQVETIIKLLNNIDYTREMGGLPNSLKLETFPLQTLEALLPWCQSRIAEIKLEGESAIYGYSKDYLDLSLQINNHIKLVKYAQLLPNIIAELDLQNHWVRRTLLRALLIPNSSLDHVLDGLEKENVFTAFPEPLKSKFNSLLREAAEEKAVLSKLQTIVNPLNEEEEQFIAPLLECLHDILWGLQDPNCNKAWQQSVFKITGDVNQKEMIKRYQENSPAHHERFKSVLVELHENASLIQQGSFFKQKENTAKAADGAAERMAMISLKNH